MIDALRARLRLHDHWRDLLRYAWSLRLLVVALACDAVAMFCSFFTDAPEPWRTVFALAGTLATLLAGLARLMPQANLPAPGEPEAR